MYPALSTPLCRTASKEIHKSGKPLRELPLFVYDSITIFISGVSTSIQPNSTNELVCKWKWMRYENSHNKEKVAIAHQVKLILEGLFRMLRSGATYEEAYPAIYKNAKARHKRNPENYAHLYGTVSSKNRQTAGLVFPTTNTDIMKLHDISICRWVPYDSNLDKFL
jgi:hypothetical protein